MTNNRWAVILALTPLLLASGLQAAPCLKDQGNVERAEGRLAVKNAKDAAGRPQRPYILTLEQPVCLDSDDAESQVETTRTIHIYATDSGVMAAIAKLVGKRVAVVGSAFAAHTAHHHAPIVMDITAITLK
jgi:hypothetical protein